MKSEIIEISLPYELKNFYCKSLCVDSEVLRKNRFSDPTRRHNYVLIPKKTTTKFMAVIFHLSGYFGTGYQNFASKTLKENHPQMLDREAGKIPTAIHVYVDASTFLGGSQFINSSGFGNYEDYLLKELVPAVKEHFGTNKKWALCGASSGGYGGLSLISQKNNPFTVAMAVAPDSFFDVSLLTELYQMAPRLKNYDSISKIKKAYASGEVQKRRYFFHLSNVLAMSLCYSPQEALRGGKIEFPIDLHTGLVKEKLWKKWLANDPIQFLAKRKANLKGKFIYLDVGTYDNYSLQFGSRQIHQVLKKIKVSQKYSEFSGDHHNLGPRKLEALKWLKKKWGA